MLSLVRLRPRFPSFLLVDSASTLVQVGLFRAGEAPVWEQSTEESSTSLFRLVQALASRCSMPLGQLDAFVFCEGPGSVLGIRTAAVALRTWKVLRPRPVFGYQSLALVAAAQLQQGLPPPFSVIADARRQSWHLLPVAEAGATPPLLRVAPEALKGPLLTPAEFRHWSPLPEGTSPVPYAVGSLLERVPDAALFAERADPDAFLHEEPSYLTWTPTIHRAPK
jgi:tRNA threonylcarbamoyladenosine biosynthesis protein TsaB